MPKPLAAPCTSRCCKGEAPPAASRSRSAPAKTRKNGAASIVSTPAASQAPLPWAAYQAAMPRSDRKGAAGSQNQATSNRTMPAAPESAASRGEVGMTILCGPETRDGPRRAGTLGTAEAPLVRRRTVFGRGTPSRGGRRAGDPLPTVRRVRRLRAWALDAFLVLLAAGEAASVLAGHAEEKPLAAGVSALSALVLIGRRRQPLAASIAAFALTALAITAVVPITTAQFFGILATFAITGAINAEREAVVAWLAGALMLAYGTWHAGGPGKASDYALTLAFATTMWAAGLLVRRRTRDTRAAVLRAEVAERDRQEQARRAVAEERARIARELHDVVSHGLSVIVLQTMAARAELADAPAGKDVDRHLDAVEEIARESLGEMRRMLDLLQADDLSPAPDAPDAPAPGLASLPALLERAAAAGLEVQAAHVAVDAALPAALELSVYRVVQEALTNAVKHAPNAAVAVAVTVADDRVAVTVTNDAGDGAPRAPAGAGHGLVGMRQRTDLFGGTLAAGPTSDGGFAVTATFPVEDGAEPPHRSARRRSRRREATP